MARFESECYAQNLAGRHLICGRALLSDGGDGGSDVLFAQLDPLATQSDEGLLEPRQLTKLGESELVLSEYRFPSDVAQSPSSPMVPVEPAIFERRLGLEPQGQAGLRRAPPGWRQDPESGLFQNRRPVAEKGEDPG